MKKQNDLQKRLFGDAFITGVITVGALIVGVARLCSFFTLKAKLGGNGTPEDYTKLAGHLDIGVTAVFVGAALVFLFLTLLEIRRTGRPFTKSICRNLRTMGWIILAGGLSRTVTDVISGFMSPYSVGTTFTIVDARLIIFIVFAAAVMLFAEIVRYGCGIQEDVDSIA